jgi:hypothetical protein
MNVDEAQTRIVKYFNKERAGRKLNLGDQLDRHRAFFVGRRARSIGAAKPVLLNDPELSVLKVRIEMEFEQVDNLIEQKIADLRRNVDASPKHLDLADLAKPKTTTPVSEIRMRTNKYRWAREHRIRGIGWRAAAIHEELWTPSFSATEAQLQKEALDQAIDRRLHMVERMNFQVSVAEVLGGSWSFSGSGAMGPWKDGFRVRIFEYPRIYGAGTRQVAGFVGQTNILAAGRPPFVSTDPAWQWEPGKLRLLYNVGPGPGVRFPLSVMGDWTTDAKLANFRNLKPGIGNTASIVIDRMFTPALDWWGRSWLFCDHVVSLLHLEALLFGLRRRDPAHGEDNFNALVDFIPGKDGFVSIGNFIATGGVRKLERLMAMESPDVNSTLGADPYFENGPINENDLQIGDHLIFYNSHIFNLISASEWSLENSVVIDVDSDPATPGGTFRNRMMMQGHGTSEKRYAGYLMEVVRPLDHALDHVRKAVRAAVAANPLVTKMNWMNYQDLLVRWDPYERFPSPGAWWIKINVDPGQVQEGLEFYPGSIAQDPSPGTGYNPPPRAEAVYFPLFRPRFNNFWSGYLNAHRTNASLRLPKLDDFKADASITPGLFYGVKKALAPVLRPRVII